MQNRDENSKVKTASSVTIGRVWVVTETMIQLLLSKAFMESQAKSKLHNLKIYFF